MVSVKEAVTSATAFVEELFPGARDIRLEEVESISSNWFVVISFKTGDEPTTFASVMGANSRLFKTVLIDLENGEPFALKVWKQ
jgi:hypothetical protein